jgi:16S rRNA (guanine1516-N2)-methyltransferase
MLLLTTSYDPTQEISSEAVRWASEWRLKYVERGQSSIPRMMKKHRASVIFTFSQNEVKAHLKDGTTLFYHPSTAMIRMKRLLRGEKDPLIEISGVSPYDRVLDCTAGLGTDAIIFSHIAGEKGKITAVESEFIPSFLLSAGLNRVKTGLDPLDKAMGSIEVVHEDHLDMLRSLPDHAYDIVYFDPMFRNPVAASQAISSIRELANPQPLALRAIEEARRVATKRIVLKDSTGSEEFERLGFQKMHRPNASFTYGFIDIYH